jgi:hypothetical protein
MQNGSRHDWPTVEADWRKEQSHSEEIYDLRGIEKLLEALPLPFCKRQTSRSKTILVKNLRSRKYRLNDALAVYVEEVDDGAYEATCYDLDQYGTGPSEDDAIADLCDAVTEYFDLLDAEKDKLGKNLQAHYEYLRDVIEPR